MSSEQTYNIPIRFRRMENLHIVFWLFKDISWCMIWKPLGIAMIFPTLFFAILITIRTKEMVSELCHNLAIVFWITANSYWMISEFFSFDGIGVYGDISYKYLSVIPFALGILVLAYYYIWWKPRHRFLAESM